VGNGGMKRVVDASDADADGGGGEGGNGKASYW
jgi:hypothetical protein